MGDGEFHGKQLLQCPMDHAHFTLIKNVLSKLEFQELYGQPKDATVASGSCKFLIFGVRHSDHHSCHQHHHIFFSFKRQPTFYTTQFRGHFENGIKILKTVQR